MDTLSEKRFNLSAVKKNIDPDIRVLQSIEALEEFLFNSHIVDDVKEVTSLSSVYRVYKKQGEELLTIYPFKSDFRVKISGYKWDLVPFLSLPINLEFIMDKTVSWTANQLSKVETTQLIQTFRDSLGKTDSLEQLMKYILLVLKAYRMRSSNLSQSEKFIVDKVMASFWKGELNELKDLYNAFLLLEKNSFNQFIKKWEERLHYSVAVEPQSLASSMDINKEKLNNVLHAIQVYLNQLYNKYIHSEKNLWFDLELLQDKEKFNLKVGEIRITLITMQEYIMDIGNLIYEEEESTGTNARIKGDSSYSEEAPQDNFTSLLIDQSQKGDMIGFLDRPPLSKQGISALSLNGKKVALLVNHLAKGTNLKEEYNHLIRIIFDKSQSKGFTVRDRVFISFMGTYDNEEVRRKFEQRHEVKRLFVNSTLNNIFETIMEELKTHNIIKEETCYIQYKEQEKITFNYNVKIYDVT